MHEQAVGGGANPESVGSSDPKNKMIEPSLDRNGSEEQALTIVAVGDNLPASDGITVPSKVGSI